MGALLELRSVSLRFGGLAALSGLDLTVSEREVVSVIGPNGAGKTTVFNVITGVYRPSEGDVLLGGESIRGRSPHQITQAGIARTFQSLRLFINMTVADNVLCATYGHTKATAVESM
ncbi:MAG: ATP-binding cassette domain-containing protein, partial [Trebonia sp.]